VTTVIFWNMKPWSWWQFTDVRRNLLPPSSGLMDGRSTPMMQESHASPPHHRRRSALKVSSPSFRFAIVIIITMITISPSQPTAAGSSFRPNVGRFLPDYKVSLVRKFKKENVTAFLCLLDNLPAPEFLVTTFRN
jgi:hypothetical protein